GSIGRVQRQLKSSLKPSVLVDSTIFGHRLTAHPCPSKLRTEVGDFLNARSLRLRFRLGDLGTEGLMLFRAFNDKLAVPELAGSLALDTRKFHAFDLDTPVIVALRRRN